MESLYQNSVSEFDLNFFEPAANATAPPSEQYNNEARKLVIARLKDKLRSLSQVVHKARKTNEILLGVQKELQETKQELEETRNLLFEKNEEHKVTCDERSVYFQQASEYCNEIQKLKEQLAKYDQLGYDTDIKEKIISGYSEQVKGLQLELENFEKEKKLDSRALKYAKTSKINIENQLVKLLKQYVLPTTKKRNKWLTSIIKQYVPDAIKDDGDDKITMEEKVEETDIEDDSPLAQALTQRNASSDLDCVESVDTGRGSSLEFSDGEKSFHSPKYYMEDSPNCTVPNVCKKCSVPKCDVATSPMPEELSISVDSATKTTCKKCVSLSRIDSCTSPIPSLMHHEATETSFEIALEDRIDHMMINPINNVTENACSNNVKINSCTDEIEPNSRISPCQNINDVTKNETIVMFEFDSGEDDDMEDDDIRQASPEEESNMRLSASPDDFDAIVNEGDKNVTSDTPTKLLNKGNLDVFESNNYAISIDKSPEIAKSNVGDVLETRPAQIKIQITAASDSEDECLIDNVNRTPSPVQTSSIFTPEPDDGASNFAISSVPCATDNDVFDKSTNIKQILNLSKEKELLHINSSNNSMVDTESDIEIQAILDKMRLHHQFITPIPKTPPRRNVQSTKITLEETNSIAPRIQKTSETINEQIDSFSKQMQASFEPFKEILPQNFDQILRLICISRENELLRNLLFAKSNKKMKKKSRSKTQNNLKQPDIVNLNSGSMLTITNKDYAHGPEQLTVMEEDSNVEEPTYSQTYIHHNENVQKEKSPEVRNCTETNAALQKLGYCDLNVTHKSAHVLFGSEDESETVTVTQPNEVSALTTIHSKNSLVYESATDSEDDTLQIVALSQKVNENSGQEKVKRRKGKAKKLTKLDKFRSVMTPKSKIKRDFIKPSKKPRIKPTPITPPVPKKRVTSSDTAASLNDKTVYENAVKVFAALKTQKQPRIVIEDCVLYPSDTENNVNFYKPGNQRKLSESVTSSPKPVASNLSSKSPDFVTTKGKRNSTVDENHCNASKELTLNSNASKSSQNVLATQKKRTKTSCVDESLIGTPSKIRRKSYNTLTLVDTNDFVNAANVKRLKRNNTKSYNLDLEKCVKNVLCVTFNKSDLEMSGTNVVEQSSVKCDAIKTKRKRTSSITSPNPKRRNSNSLEPEPPRILRSSCIKNKDTQKSPIVAEGRELRSKVDQTQPEQKDTQHLLCSGRRQRISRVKTNTQQDSDSSIYGRKEKKSEEVSESTQISSPSNTRKAITAQETVAHEITTDRVVSYADLDFLMDQDDNTPEPKYTENKTTDSANGRKDSLLCRTIEKHCVKNLNFTAKRVPESKIKDLWEKLETSLSEIEEFSHEECKDGMKKLVAEIRTWDVKMFIRAFITYLRQPERKIELFSKTVSPPLPPMTKKEQVLLYVMDELQKSSDYRNIVNKILKNIEFTLFALNKPAEGFDVVEAMSHFYALLCRSYEKLSKLRLFIADAMYCLQLKSIVLVQQCLEVWMLTLPLGHMGLAKCPLVTCLVYLLHFYKCEDRFNRVRDIRNTLRWKYNYDMSNWSEPKILEYFRTAITEIKESTIHKRILRLAILLLAKRNGAMWCHNNIVKNMLQPLIDDNDTSESAKRFALSLLGPLLKPYPPNMKVHSETIISYLMDLLEKKNSIKIQEAIISSMLCFDKSNNNNRVHRFLAGWKPKQVSPDFEYAFKSYVRTKRWKTWKSILSWHI